MAPKSLREANSLNQRSSLGRELQGNRTLFQSARRFCCVSQSDVPDQITLVIREDLSLVIFETSEGCAVDDAIDRYVASRACRTRC